MTRPSAWTMFFGHILVSTALGLATLFLGWQWMHGTGSGMLAFIIFLTTIASRTAYTKARAYQLWKREWDAMGGAAPAIAISGPTARKMVGLLCWLGMAWAALASASDPGMELPVGLFWLASAAMPIIGLHRLFRRAAPRGAAREKHMTVTVCIRAPSRSNDLSHAYAVLPVYCKGLLNEDILG